MKKYSNTAAAFLMGLILFTSCSKSTVAPSTPANPSTNDLTSNLSSGSWIVSSLTEKGEDKTGKFAGFHFVFLANGGLKASKNGVETQGSWQYTAAVTYYGSTSTAAISISLGNSTPLDLLTGKWNMVSSSSTSLKADSPEIAQDEHLAFSKE